MSKTITLNETQMRLLEQYMKTAADVVSLAEQCNENMGQPGERMLQTHFENMCWKRDKDARVLAESLSVSYAEQGPRVNPAETAGGTETSDSLTGQQESPTCVS